MNPPKKKSTDKPLYAVPSMAAIRRRRCNGLTAASTFSGCGGSSLGYRMAGFRVLYASEFVEAARDCYEANAAKHTFVDGRDIREVAPEDMLEKMGLAKGELDLLDGSPPCASFSTAGKREKHWGEVKKYSDTKQRTDDLFFEFARIVGGVQPRVFVAENVSGLIKGAAKGYFKEILRALKGCGYRVEARLLDAQWLGVPQARKRIIFVGVREDLGLDPVFPAPLPYRYSVSDAIPGIATTLTNKSYPSVERSPGEPAPTILAGGPSDKSGMVVPEGGDLADYEIGKEWDKLPPGGQSARYFSLVKPDPSKPSPTVTAEGGVASLASVTHPTERRKFSIPELRRICGFPDDFVLLGTYAKQWERLGRAVPPVMMEKIAVAIRDGVLKKAT